MRDCHRSVPWLLPSVVLRTRELQNKSMELHINDQPPVSGGKKPQDSSGFGKVERVREMWCDDLLRPSLVVALR
jgi:hypothetical protein